MSHTITQVGSSELEPRSGNQMRAGVYRGKGRVDRAFRCRAVLDRDLDEGAEQRAGAAR